MPLARLLESLPLVCPKRAAHRYLVAFITDGAALERILGYIGEPSRAAAIVPARGPPARSHDLGIRSEPVVDRDPLDPGEPELEFDQGLSWSPPSSATEVDPDLTPARGACNPRPKPRRGAFGDTTKTSAPLSVEPSPAFALAGCSSGRPRGPTEALGSPIPVRRSGSCRYAIPGCTRRGHPGL